MTAGPVYLQISGAAGRMDNYCAAVRGAGGEPLAGCCPAPDLRCDGLVLCGGGDLESTLYGQENRGSHPPDRERDRAELALFRAFYGAGRPILGICRGMQLINVALGGDLIQDLPPEQRALHTAPEGDLVHTVRARPGGLLHDLYGPSFSVNSAHHQAIDKTGRELRIVQTADDGIIEGIAHDKLPILGVQWHPERQFSSQGYFPAAHAPADEPADGRLLFSYFLSLCSSDA